MTPTKEFIEDRNARFDPDLLTARVRSRARAFSAINAEALAEHHFGDAIYTNMIMLGMAWQNGLIPVSDTAIYEANRLNKVKVAENAAAFDLGRIAAVKPEAIQALAPKRPEIDPPTLDELIARRSEMLRAYQNAAYADMYEARVARVRAAESNLKLGEQLTRAAATYLAKLMAYKDEYEVARLYRRPEYRQAVEDTFGKGAKLTFLMAPPMISKKNHKGELIKQPFGPWMMTAFKLLKSFKWLRGTAFDIFGMTAERKMERRLRDEYLARLEKLAAGLTPENHALAVEIASHPGRDPRLWPCEGQIGRGRRTAAGRPDGALEHARARSAHSGHGGGVARRITPCETSLREASMFRQKQLLVLGGMLAAVAVGVVVVSTSRGARLILCRPTPASALAHARASGCWFPGLALFARRRACGKPAVPEAGCASTARRASREQRVRDQPALQPEYAGTGSCSLRWHGRGLALVLPAERASASSRAWPSCSRVGRGGVLARLSLRAVGAGVRNGVDRLSDFRRSDFSAWTAFQ